MYKLLLSPFWLVVFVVWLNLSVLRPTLVCACRTRSTDHQRVQRYAPFHSTDNSATVGIRDSLWMFFSYKKMLGRSETRTRERKYLGRIRSVWDISRGDRARIATCSLQTSTDRFKANYSIDSIIVVSLMYTYKLLALNSILFYSIVERGSSLVECQTRNRVSPGSNPPLLPFRKLGIFVLFIVVPVD